MELIDRIEAIVGSRGLLLGDDVRARPNHAAWQGQCPARAIVRPASTEELSQVLKLCHAANQPLVPMGGLTGLVDGTCCSDSDIGISLERMNAIESVDADAGIMVVQSGVALQSVQERAEEAGWQFALDLGARGSATIGGNIATNAGGNSVVRYGMMREQVLGLEAVLADGTVISSMNEMLKNNAGYDLKQLFIGTEGTLGIVTRAVLRLRPQMPDVQTALLALDSFPDVVSLLRRLGTVLEGKLSAFEVIWQEHYRLLLGPGGHRAVLPDDHAYYVLLESSGSGGEEAADRFMEILGQFMEDGMIADAVIAQSQQQAAELWEMRDDVEVLFKEFSPPFGFDISLPLRHMQAYIANITERLKQACSDSHLSVFGHLGDGNLHVVVGRFADRHAVEEIVYRELERFGGSISAEHGVGLEKKAYLPCSRGPAEIALMKTLKQALDPKNILNPGKVL